MSFVAWSLAFALMVAGEALPATGGDPQSPRSDLCAPSHIGFYGDTRVVTDSEAGKIHYSKRKATWKTSAFALKAPHSVTLLPNGQWLINDANNHRVIQTDDLSGSGNSVIRSTLAGIKLSRPHDQVVDPETGHVYLIDGSRTLFRFRSLDGPVEAWSFAHPAEMDYARSLSWMDGKLHIIHSSRGEVLRVDDFEARKLTRFFSPRPTTGPAQSHTSHRDFPAGALSTTGLVLNDVEQFEGWYYGTNFFSPRYAKGGDTGPSRLIRWKSWQDFEAGRWEDLSDLLPASKVPLIPYYLTVGPEGLYVAHFADVGCDGGGFIVIPHAQ